MDQVSKNDLGKQFGAPGCPACLLPMGPSRGMWVDRSVGVRLPLIRFATNLLCGLFAPQLLPSAMKQLE